MLEYFSRNLDLRLQMNEIIIDEELNLCKNYLDSDWFDGRDGPFGRSFGGEIGSFAEEKLRVRLDIY